MINSRGSEPEIKNIYRKKKGRLDFSLTNTSQHQYSCSCVQKAYSQSLIFSIKVVHFIANGRGNYRTLRAYFDYEGEIKKNRRQHCQPMKQKIMPRNIHKAVLCV